MESTAGTCPDILEGILWKEAIKDHRSEQPVAVTLVGYGMRDGCVWG